MLRRIIRRAVRHAYLLGAEQARHAGAGRRRPIEVMGDAYPDVAQATATSSPACVAREEERFRQTLQNGLDDPRRRARPARASRRCRAATRVPAARHLGFPLELTAGDRRPSAASTSTSTGFDAAMAEQRRRAKDARKAAGRRRRASTRYRELRRAVRHDRVHRLPSTSETKARACSRCVPTDDGTTVEIFLDRTPFYAEPAARSATPARSRTDTGTRRGARHHLRPARACAATRPAIVEGDDRPPARRRTAAHRRRAARRHPPQPHRHPRPALGAARGARRRTSSRRARSSRPTGCASTSATTTPVTAERDRARSRTSPTREVLANDPVRALRDHQGRGRAHRRHRLLRRQVRRHRAGARGRPALASSCAAARTCRPLGDIGPIKIVSARARSARTCAASRPSPAPRPIDRLRHDEDVLAEAASLARRASPTSWSTASAPARRDQGAARRAQGAPPAGRRRTRPSSPQAAVDGVVVAGVDGLDRDDLRELALAVREQPGIRAVVLGGAPEGGGAALVAAVATGSGLNAGDAHRRRGQGGSGRRRARRRRRRGRRQGPERPRRGARAGAGGGRAVREGPRARPRVEAHRGGGVRPDRADREPRPGHPTHGLEGR